MRVAIPQSELYSQLQALGWSLKNITMKNGLFVAKGIGPAEQEAERIGQDSEGALAALLLYAQRSNAVRRMAATEKFAAWHSNWLDQAKEIAHAYSKAPVFDEKAVPAWRALAAESKMQADAIRQQLKVEVTDEPDPYKDAEEMTHDIHHNKAYRVSRSNSNHPLWSQEDNINFRIVHDVLGHAQSGGDFGWVGENHATAAHMPLISPLAREALFTERIGKAAYDRQHHGYGPQKIALLSEFLHPAQEKEGEHVFVPHGGLPALKAPNENASAEMQTPESQPEPGQSFSPAMVGIHGDGSSSVMRPMQARVAKLVSDDLLEDPNAGWSPPIRTPSVRAGSPSDYLDTSGLIDNAAKIDTEWWEKDQPTQNKAIMNAFRVAILSPRKHLKWNAAHYQALQHTDADTSAKDMWGILEDEREEHNQKLGYPEGSHLSYRKNLAFLVDQLELDGLSKTEALAKAKEIVFEKTKEFEKQLGRQGEGETSELRRANQARAMLATWLQENYSPARGWMPGQMTIGGLKKSDYQGWTNWETWNTALMMDNERESYDASRKLVEQGGTEEDLKNWAIQNVIGPENKRAIEDAQEWNDIPQHDRLDHNYEDFKAKHPDAMDLLHGLVGGPDVGDSEPQIIDDHKVNWNEIWSHIYEEFQENDRYKQEKSRLDGENLPFAMPGHSDETNRMLDAWMKHHGVMHPDQKTPEGRGAEHQTMMNVPLDQLNPQYYTRGDDPTDTWRQGEQDGYIQKGVREHGWDTLNDIQSGRAQPAQIQLMQQALEAQGYTPEQIQQFMRQQRRYDGENWVNLNQSQDQAQAPQTGGQSDLTFPDEWTSKTADWSPDPTLFDSPQVQVPDATGFSDDDSKYGAFMGAHLDALAEVGKHIDTIRDAAHDDIEDGGKGLKFRNAVMNLNLAGVNPKVASFAWLLLRPMSSDLGIIDAHMLRALGRNERDMSVKDYYKLERMQRTAKDASGYGHMPLGLYHWGLWDHARNPGSHSDHSPLRVLDPEPWEQHSWDAASSARSGPFVGHPAFEATRPYMEETARAFDDEFADQPAGMVPRNHRPIEDENPRTISPFVIPYRGGR